MGIPRKMFDELGEAAGRYNQNASRHAPGCCPTCRKAIVGMFMALLDPENWEPEDPQEKLARMQAEMDAMKQDLGHVLRQPMAAPPPPAFEDDGPREPQGARTPPPMFEPEEE